MTLDEFRKRFAKIRQLGFVPSIRSGATGIGCTLEKLLEIKENNIALPDLGEVELKTRRRNAQNMMTLFTFNKKAWIMKQLDAIHKYGTLDPNGRKGMYFTMSPTPNSSGLFLQITDENRFG